MKQTFAFYTVGVLSLICVHSNSTIGTRIFWVNQRSEYKKTKTRYALRKQFGISEELFPCTTIDQNKYKVLFVLQEGLAVQHVSY